MSEEFIWVIIFMMPVTVVMWLLGMWANHEDYKKKHNIKGWSDKDMNVKQLIVISLVSTVVGISGYLVGTYYGAISMLDTMYENVESELDELESNLKEYVGSKYAVSCSSGTDALLMSLLAINIKLPPIT